jgi:hypothetical protein
MRCNDGKATRLFVGATGAEAGDHRIRRGLPVIIANRAIALTAMTPLRTKLLIIVIVM